MAKAFAAARAAVLLDSEGKPYCEVPLTRGRVAWVDPDDFPLVTGYGWFACQTRSRTELAGGRKERWVARGQVNGRKVNMHRLVMGEPPGVQVDHVRHQTDILGTLDNRRANLRLATSSQQNSNRRGKNRYKGVWYRPRVGAARPWRAAVMFKGKRYHLGSFATAEKAALAYNAKAVELFGEFALLNVVPTADPK
jgi:hypothetical protein